MDDEHITLVNAALLDETSHPSNPLIFYTHNRYKLAFLQSKFADFHLPLHRAQAFGECFQVTEIGNENDRIKFYEKYLLLLKYRYIYNLRPQRKRSRN